jgi:protease II
MVLATVSLSPMLGVEDASRATPPTTPEHDVIENYHGRQVHDPYRWLEQAGAPVVEQWIDAQNAYTDAVMSGFRDHGVIIERASQVALTSTQRSNPQIVANVLFYMRQTPPQPQPSISLIIVRDYGRSYPKHARGLHDGQEPSHRTDDAPVNLLYDTCLISGDAVPSGHESQTKV